MEQFAPPHAVRLDERVRQFHAHLRAAGHFLEVGIDENNRSLESFAGGSWRDHAHLLSGPEPGQVAFVGVEQQPHLGEVSDFEQLLPLLHILAFVHMTRHDCAGHGGEDLRMNVIGILRGQGGDLRIGLAEPLQPLQCRRSQIGMVRGFARLGGCRGLFPQRDIFPLCREQHRAVERGQRLACDDFRAHVVDGELVDAAVNVGRDDAVAGVVIVDGAREAKRALQRLTLHGVALHVDDLDRVGPEGDDSLTRVEALVAFVHRRKLHAAYRAAPGLVRYDPRMHGALVMENLATAGCGHRRVRGGTPLPRCQPTACRSCGGHNDDEEKDAWFHGWVRVERLVPVMASSSASAER